jgi:hypothetical protein
MYSLVFELKKINCIIILYYSSKIIISSYCNHIVKTNVKYDSGFGTWLISLSNYNFYSINISFIFLNQNEFKFSHMLYWV